MRYRSIFLSDIHLGARACRAELLLEFLREHEADRWYLVGDIFDGWRLRRRWHWPDAHSQVLETMLDHARAGAEIFYIPGNHDEFARAYQGMHFCGVEVMERADHVAADGKRYLVTHGDQFDSVVVHARWLAYLGDRAYDVLLRLNTMLDRARRLWNGPYWSLSQWAKQQVKQAVNFVSAYETVLTDEARRGGYDGVICGHIHQAAMRKIGALDYVNTGDWVESCTAVAEREDGELLMIDWADRMNRRRTKGALRVRPWRKAA